MTMPFDPAAELRRSAEEVLQVADMGKTPEDVAALLECAAGNVRIAEAIEAKDAEIAELRERVAALEAVCDPEEGCFIGLAEAAVDLAAKDKQIIAKDAEIARLLAEVQRLDGVLERIDGGDTPCTDEAVLRQWAYEARTLGRDADNLTPPEGCRR